jgi:hypothetical protein
MIDNKFMIALLETFNDVAIILVSSQRVLSWTMLRVAVFELSFLIDSSRQVSHLSQLVT